MSSKDKPLSQEELDVIEREVRKYGKEALSVEDTLRLVADVRRYWKNKPFIDVGKFVAANSIRKLNAIFDRVHSYEGQ